MHPSRLLLFVLATTACGHAPDLSTSYADLSALGATLGAGVEGAALGAGKAADQVTVEVLELPVVDWVTPALARTCWLRARVDERRWSLVPGSQHACDPARGAEAAPVEGREWLIARAGGRTDEAAVGLARTEFEAAFAEQTLPLVAQADAWGLDFDLNACVTSRLAVRAKAEAQAATLRCDAFQQPGFRQEEFAARLAMAAAAAQKRLDEAVVRSNPTADPTVVATCGAIAAPEGLDLPGAAEAQMAEGLGVAFPLALEAGEKLDLRASSNQFDTFLELRDAACEQLLAANDDGGRGYGRNSHLVWEAAEAGAVVAVVRAYRGSLTAGFEIKASFANRPVLTPAERVGLEQFVAAVRGLSPEDLGLAWHADASSEIQTACVDSFLLDESEGRGLASVETAAAACRKDLELAIETTRAAQTARAGLLGQLGALLTGGEG